MGPTAIREMPRQNPPRKADFKDLAIETLADSEAALCEEVAKLRAEVVVLKSWGRQYREMSKAAIHELHRVIRERDQARATIAAMREAQREQQQAA
jgi:hypothetical protein